MRESRLGRWVARTSVTLGLSVVALGGVAVLSAGSAMAAPGAGATLTPVTNTSLSSTGTVYKLGPAGVNQPDDWVWW